MEFNTWNANNVCLVVRNSWRVWVNFTYSPILTCWIIKGWIVLMTSRCFQMRLAQLYKIGLLCLCFLPGFCLNILKFQFVSSWVKDGQRTFKFKYVWRQGILKNRWHRSLRMSPTQLATLGRLIIYCHPQLDSCKKSKLKFRLKLFTTYVDYCWVVTVTVCVFF